MYELICTSLIASIGISISSAPIGAILLWQRMAFLGDTLAHASLLGVAISLLFSMPLMLGVFFVVFLLVYLFGKNNKLLSNDALLAIIVYGCLSIAIVIISKIPGRFNLDSYLLGDILAINHFDIIAIYIMGSIVILWLYLRFDKLILTSINKDLASSSGVNTKFILLEFRMIIACLIAISMKIVGILLISALLIIPAAAARNYSKTPERMILLAVIFSVISSILGVMLAFYFDLPVGPSIIIMSLLFFIISNI
jgi:zinc transport system permease protein